MPINSQARSLLLALTLLSIPEVGTAQTADTGPELSNSVKHDTMIVPLRRLPPLEAISAVRRHEKKPIRLNPHTTVNVAPPGTDPALQTLAVTTGKAAPETKPAPAKPAGAVLAAPRVEGIGDGFHGMVIRYAPPDTNGAVGRDQYVQWVNTEFAVFQKRRGATLKPTPLYGPVDGSVIWRNFGGNCEKYNDGDPVVQYDKIANRWILAQFVVHDGYSYCVAVSTGADATDTYHRYEFKYAAFDDYPKLTVWPDGYYVSFNMYQGDAFIGSRVCAYERSSMLQGGDARAQCYQLNQDYFGLLPSDLDGATVGLINSNGTPGPDSPPAGTPNFFVALGTKAATLDLWKFHVDWQDSTKTTFGLGANHAPDHTIKVPPYSFACSGSGGACVPQPGNPLPEALDSLGDRLMFRVAYRRFGDRQAIILTHSVDTGSGNTGVRWYELSSLNGSDFRTVQASTFAPDANHRWMASAAMDNLGTIILGYGISGRVFPGLRFTWRAPADTPSLLRNEQPFTQGHGTQRCRLPDGTCLCPLDDGSCDSLTRWGDYSNMTVDPVDGCTLWYTGEYAKNTGAYNWHTQIGSLKYSDCKPR